MYRTLKRMEKNGELTSYQEKGGPKGRRVFQVTELGRYSLSNWEESLRRYSRHIDQLLEAIQKNRE